MYPENPEGLRVIIGSMNMELLIMDAPKIILYYFLKSLTFFWSYLNWSTLWCEKNFVQYNTIFQNYKYKIFSLFRFCPKKALNSCQNSSNSLHRTIWPMKGTLNLFYKKFIVSQSMLCFWNSTTDLTLILRVFLLLIFCFFVAVSDLGIISSFERVSAFVCFFFIDSLRSWANLLKHWPSISMVRMLR